MLTIYSMLFCLALKHMEATKSIGCGIPVTKNGIENKITGGKDATQRDWPWNVQLVFPIGKAEYRVFCGGSLLNRRWVITAAHCFFEKESTKALKKNIDLALVIFGDLGVPKDSIERELNLKDVHIHESFDGIGKNDISLIHMLEPIKFSDYVRPICLPIDGEGEGEGFDGKEAIVTGWGRLSSDSKGKPTQLQAARVEVFSSWECWYTYIIGLCGLCVKDIMLEDTICAGGSGGGADACKGDSGSPLVVKRGDGSWMLLGVVSGGVECGKKWSPALYTYVPKYTRWIRDKMQEYSYHATS